MSSLTDKLFRRFGRPGFFPCPPDEPAYRQPKWQRILVVRMKNPTDQPALKGQLVRGAGKRLLGVVVDTIQPGDSGYLQRWGEALVMFERRLQARTRLDWCYVLEDTQGNGELSKAFITIQKQDAYEF